MKAADISDEAFLAAVDAVSPFWYPPDPGWAMLDDVADLLGYPWKVVLAKARRLIRRGVLHGCYCGCRGDLHRPRGDCCGGGDE